MIKIPLCVKIHLEILDDLHDFERRGLLKQNHWKMWQKDFEDLFQSELIVEAMRNLSEAKGFVFNMDVSRLNDERKVKNVLKIICGQKIK